MANLSSDLMLLVNNIQENEKILREVDGRVEVSFPLQCFCCCLLLAVIFFLFIDKNLLNLFQIDDNIEKFDTLFRQLNEEFHKILSKSENELKERNHNNVSVLQVICFCFYN